MAAAVSHLQCNAIAYMKNQMINTAVGMKKNSLFQSHFSFCAAAELILFT